ncbi:MAG: hypothetical protein FD146_3 [Anaerolineaceae bacterium]|nr:MAG: hypothetical protein FD146_3 [Anaerolineaceae bacterium]
MKRTNLLWITALVLGWLFDFLFWKHTPGINFAVYAVLCLGGGFLVLALNGIKPAWKSLLLLAPILFFAAMTFVRREPMSLFLAYAFTLTLMGILVQTYLGGRWLKYSLSDYVVNFFKMMGSLIARPIIFLTERKKQEGESPDPAAPAPRSGWKRTWAVLRGLLIALPIVAVFAALLSSADLIFAERLDEFIKMFRLEKLPEYIFRLIYILIGAYMLAGLFLHAAQKSRDESLIGEDKPLAPAFLGFTEAAVVLGAVNLLFLAFVFVQFRYFFGGQANISVEGYTFSEYARRGFGELVMVAVFSLLMFLSLSAVTKRETAAQRWTFSGLGVLLVALVGVMLFSAFQRLSLYEAAYGFSRMRTYPHVFMIWLGILLAAVAVLDILRKERFFALAAMLASVGFALTLTLLNVDGFIVRQNIARAADGEGLDVPYLASLSTDAVPALAAAYTDESLPGYTLDAVGAALVCWQYRNSGDGDTDWRAFTLSGWLAEQALQQARRNVNSQLSGYRISDSDYPAKVLTPGSIYYECYQTYSD